MDRKDLKIQALLERVSSLTAEYENKVADLRVSLTEVSTELERLQASDAEVPEGEEVEIVEGEVA